MIMSRVINWYPLLTPQQDPVECGFVCVSAIAAMYGFPTSVAGLRQLFGGTSRGLKLHELQHVLQVAGARTQAFAFDVSRLGAYPSPGIVLLKRAHYVVIGRISQKYVSVFDPATGAWRNLRPERLARESTGFGILVTAFKPAVSNERPADDGLARRVLRASVSRFGLRVACLAVLAQLIGMSLPLATGLFVNAITKNQTNGVALLAIGYLAVSAVGSVTWIISRAAREYLTARVQTMTSGWLLDRLACMDQGSFDRCSRATLHGQIGALSELQSFYSTVIAKIGDAAVLTIVGAIALIFVSPWLAVPGFIALGISVTLDVAFRKRLQESQTDLQHVSRESMHFTLDILSQFPVFSAVGCTNWSPEPVSCPHSPLGPRSTSRCLAAGKTVGFRRDSVEHRKYCVHEHRWVFHV